jgi:hypothetical protein
MRARRTSTSATGIHGHCWCIWLQALVNLNSEVEQVVLVLLLVLVLENSRSLAVPLIERNSAGIFGPCFDAESQPIEREHESLTSESRASSKYWALWGPGVFRLHRRY